MNINNQKINIMKDICIIRTSENHSLISIFNGMYNNFFINNETSEITRESSEEEFDYLFNKIGISYIIQDGKVIKNIFKGYGNPIKKGHRLIPNKRIDQEEVTIEDIGFIPNTEEIYKKWQELIPLENN